MSNMFRSVLLFVLPAATACADPGTEPPAVDVPAPPAAQAAVWTQSIDPCTLLTRAEVEGVVGRAVQDPQPDPGNAALCDFSLGDDGIVGVATQDLAMDHTPERMMAELQQRNVQVTETSGIGLLFRAPRPRHDRAEYVRRTSLRYSDRVHCRRFRSRAGGRRRATDALRAGATLSYTTGRAA
jgi:hypothetical protein